MHYPIRVLFLCTGNSARSQMAEAILRTFGGQDFEVFSAGTKPETIHPMTIQVMQDADIDISKQESKHLNQYLGEAFDYIITVCDRAREDCPVFPGDNKRIHWSFEDPAVDQGSMEKQYQLFSRIRTEISERVRVWITVQRKELKDEGIRTSS